MLLLFFLLWIILNGRVTAEIVIFGGLISALLFCSVIVTSHSRAKHSLFGTGQ